MYCSNCGIALPQQGNYCNNCSTIIMKTIISDPDKVEYLIMEARVGSSILQLYETKIIIIRLTFSGKVNSEKEVPLNRIKSINFTECSLMQTGIIQFTIEGESGGFWQNAENAIIWSFKGQNYQFKLINEAILQKKALIR
jgi:hypothetical protein